MSDHLYRFRSSRTLVGDFNELENQHIYFSPPAQLNDPLEGFKDIVWVGDSIVWRNLLRHYLLCLMQATILAAMSGKDFTQESCGRLVRLVPDDLPEAPIKEKYASICTEFLDAEAPQALLAALTPTRRVRRDELLFYLRALQSVALSTVVKGLEHQGLALVQADVLEQASKKMAIALESVLSASSTEDMADAVFSITENMASQINLVHDYSNAIAEDRRGWLFVYRDFPSFYVNALEALLYPNWHTACFVESPTNASMWGTYGDSHRGVALKFKTPADAAGIRALDLYQINGWTGGRGVIAPAYGYVRHRFAKVQYTADYPQIDFFESLGTLSMKNLGGFWYAGPNGECSVVAARILTENSEWREEYWRTFGVGNTTKSTEWAHEAEYRLVLYSNLHGFEDLESRRLKYRFADLTGVVFGIKTSTEDKHRIIRIIERKCIAESRTDFEFLQAHYSVRTRRIELVPLTLIKFV
jgi:Protein of unknown function (DUF2971)